jgi:hypothetical protein
MPEENRTEDLLGLSEAQMETRFRADYMHGALETIRTIIATSESGEQKLATIEGLVETALGIPNLALTDQERAFMSHRSALHKICVPSSQYPPLLAGLVDKGVMTLIDKESVDPRNGMLLNVYYVERPFHGLPRKDDSKSATLFLYAGRDETLL